MARVDGLLTDFMTKFLSAEDRSAYDDMAARFQAVIEAKPHSGLKEFSEQITSVHGFIRRSEVSQSLRAMVCGIFFGPRFILVNTSRLKNLLGRSKSGMNNHFQKLGYDVMRPSNEIIGLFQRLLPHMAPQLFQLNKWCLRIETDGSKMTFLSHIPDEIAATFETERISPKAEQGQKGTERFRADLFPWDLRCLLNRDPPNVPPKQTC
jgi:hypothetical protein